MPRPRKYAQAKPRCFHVDSLVYERLRRVLAERFGKSISEEVNELLRRRLAELEGEAQSEALEQNIRYEELKRAYEVAVFEVERLKGLLRRLGCYEELKALAYELGLDFNAFSNMEEVASKLFSAYNGPTEHVHLLITLMEAAKNKRQIEKELAQLRLKH